MFSQRHREHSLFCSFMWDHHHSALCRKKLPDKPEKWEFKSSYCFHEHTVRLPNTSVPLLTSHALIILPSPPSSLTAHLPHRPQDRHGSSTLQSTVGLTQELTEKVAETHQGQPQSTKNNMFCHEYISSCSYGKLLKWTSWWHGKALEKPSMNFSATQGGHRREEIEN